MRIGVERKFTIWFILALSICLFFTFLTFKSKINHKEINRTVNLSYQIQTEIQNIQDDIQQLQIASHHYAVTGSEVSVKECRDALGSLDKSLAHLARLTAGNPAEQKLVDLIDSLKEKKLKDQQDSFQVRNEILEGKNHRLLDSVKSMVSRLDYMEDQIIDQKIIEQQIASENDLKFMTALVFLFLIISVILYRLKMVDIRKRAIAEMKLKDSEAFLFKIFNESRDALLLVNNNTGLIEKCNKGAVSLFGVNSEKGLLLTNADRFCKIPVDEQDQKAIDEAIRKDGVWKDNVEYISATGREFWGAISMSRFEFNSTEHLLIRVADITEEKNYEQALKTYTEALEQSEARLQGLASELIEKNEQLKKSEEELRELNASKDKFFSILAHDLRSPFTGLLGISEYLAECNDIILKEEVKDLAGAIYGSAKNVYGLLNNLLEWSRLKIGKMEYFPQNINLYEIAMEITELQRPNASSKDISLENNIDDDIYVHADENMASAIFRNLISNSIKFTKAGGSISISAEVKNEWVEVRVSDTGIGMTEEVKNKIFRLDSKYTTKGTAGEQGTGLGLILCKELVEKNKGVIWVESEVGKGSQFIFLLPLGVKGRQPLRLLI